MRQFFEHEKIILQFLNKHYLGSDLPEDKAAFSYGLGNIFYSQSKVGGSAKANPNSSEQQNMELLKIEYCQVSIQLMFNSIQANPALSSFIHFPFFLSRCREIIESFIRDEKLFGVMSFNRMRVKEMCNILEKLRDLKLQKNQFKLIPTEFSYDALVHKV